MPRRSVDPPQRQHHQQDRHGEHHVAAVEARVAEQRGHPEVVGVVVRHRQVGGEEEQLARRGLVEPDRREHHARGPTPTRASARGAQSGKGARADHGHQQRERDREVGEQLGRGREPVGPGERQAGEGDEGGGGIRDHARQRARRAGLGAQHPPRQRQRGGREHEVERQQPPELAVVGDRDREAAAGLEGDRRPQRSGDQHGDRHPRGPAHRDRGERRRARPAASHRGGRRRRRR